MRHPLRLLFLLLPLLLLARGFGSSLAAFIPASSPHFPATTFSTKLMSREQGVGLPVNRMKLPKGSDAMRMGDVSLLLHSSPLDIGLVASNSSPASGLLSRGSRAGTASCGLLWRWGGEDCTATTDKQLVLPLQKTLVAMQQRRGAEDSGL